MLVVCTWLWGNKFNTVDVVKLAAGIRRHLKQPHRFVCFSDRKIQVEGIVNGALPNPELTTVRGCFARLRMFDPEWQRIWVEDRVACLDLDTVVTGQLDPLFDRPEPFVIMQGANRHNPCPFNGALQLIRAGAHPEVWKDFSLEAASRAPFFEFPDDQGWIHHKVPKAAGWKVGPEYGVYVWQKRGWPGGSDLPRGARLVTFVNKGPRDIVNLPWVQEHWR